jgi:ferrous iron transport protein B
LLTGAQLAVSCVALTLFLPCIAQFLINVKERGVKTGLAVAGLTLTFSFGVAFALNLVLRVSGVLS